MIWSRIALFLGFLSFCCAWNVGKQLVYDYRGEAFASVWDLKDSFAVNELKGKLVVQVVDEETLTVQLGGVTAASQAQYDGNPYLVGNYDFQLGSNAQKLIISDSTPLERPFQIKHKNGAVQGIHVSEEDPVWAVNVKKAIASVLQLDINSITGESLFVKEIVYGDEEESNRAVDVVENSIFGNCLTSIKVNELTGAEIVTNKNYKVVEELCSEDSKIYELFKQVDIDSCSNRPVLSSVTPPIIACRPGESRCGDMIQHVAGARFYACRNAAEGWKVIRSDSFNDFIAAPFGPKSEKLFTGGFVSILLNNSGPIVTPLQAPASPAAHSSLAYGFPEAMDASGNLHQPGFEDAPLNRPANILSKKNSILQLIRDIADQLSRAAAESDSDNFDFASRLLEARRYMAQMKLSEIREIARGVEEDESTTVRFLLVDILASTGTPASAKFVADVLRKGKLGNWPSSSSAADVAMMLFHYINLPTTELLNDLVGVVRALETGQTNEDVHKTSLMGMAELLYHACVSSFFEDKRYPSKAYGSFCSVENAAYEHFLTYVTELLGKASTSFDKMAYLTVIGTLGTKEIVPLLLPYIRGVADKETAIRTRAVLSLHRYAYSAPEKVFPIVNSLYDNSAENPEVRMAALAIMLNSNAPYSTWQKVAWNTYFEQNNQVAAFTTSIIRNLAELSETNTQYTELIKKAKAAAMILKDFKMSSLFSRSSHFAKWLSDFDAGILVHIPVWKTGYQQGPVATSARVLLQLGPHIYNLLQVFKWSYGFEQVTDKLVAAFSKPVKQSRPREPNLAQAYLDTLYKKLGIEKRVQEEINTFVQISVLGHMHRLQTLDDIDKTLPKAVKLISDAIGKPDGYSLKMQKYRSWTDIHISLPTVLGLPTTYEGYYPSLASVQAKVKGSASSLRNFNVSLDGNTLASWSRIGKMSITFPFTNSYVAAGVETRTLARLPRRMNLALGYKDPETFDVQFVVSAPGGPAAVMRHKVIPFLIAGSVDDFSPNMEKEGYNVIHVREAHTKYMHLGPLIPVTVMSERPDEAIVTSVPSVDQIIDTVLPKTVHLHELTVGLSLPGRPSEKLSTMKLEFQRVRSRKYYAGNFKYFESGSGSPAPRPRAVPVGEFDLEADKEIAGGYFSNQKLTLSFNNEEVASTTLNIAQDYYHSFRKVTLILNNEECIKVKQEAPVFSKFENSPANTESKISLYFGKDCSQRIANGEILLSRSEKQLEYAKATPEYTTCAAEMAAGITDSKACTAARLIADTYDKISVKVQGYSKNKFLKDIVSSLTERERSQLSGKYEMGKVEDDGTLSMNVSFSTDGMKYNLITRHDGEKATYNNVPVSLSAVFPLNARKNLWDYATEYITYGAQNPTCHISSNRVQTFDGATYDYTIDECDHLVTSDCSGKTKFAVLLSRESQGNFTVRVITDADRFEINSYGVVDVNKKKTISLKESGVGMVSSDYVVTSLFRRGTGDYVVVLNSVNIFVYFRGNMVTIKAALDHPGRLCGLCGDNNYELSKEFSDPKRCALNSGELMAASYRVNLDSCAPLPENVQSALKEHRQNCRSVDQIIRSALPLASDTCKLKRSKDGHEKLVCGDRSSNGPNNGSLGG